MIAVLVLGSLVVVFTRGAPAQLPVNTPSGTVQAYVTAYLAGDDGAAAAYLRAPPTTDCAVYSGLPQDIRVKLVSTDERPDDAIVRVAIVASDSAGPFGAAEVTSEGEFRLVRTGNGWQIIRTPWQFTRCATPEGRT